MEEGWPSGWSVERAVIMTPLRVSRVGKWMLPLVVNSDDVDTTTMSSADDPRDPSLETKLTLPATWAINTAGELGWHSFFEHNFDALQTVSPCRACCSLVLSWSLEIGRLLFACL